jgi:hypothetical protein
LICPPVTNWKIFGTSSGQPLGTAGHKTKGGEPYISGNPTWFTCEVFADQQIYLLSSSGYNSDTRQAAEISKSQSRIRPEKSEPTRKPWMRQNGYNFSGCLAHIEISDRLSDSGVYAIVGHLEHNPDCQHSVLRRPPAVPLHSPVYEVALMPLASGARYFFSPLTVSSASSQILPGPNPSGEDPNAVDDDGPELLHIPVASEDTTGHQDLDQAPVHEPVIFDLYNIQSNMANSYPECRRYSKSWIPGSYHTNSTKGRAHCHRTSSSNAWFIIAPGRWSIGSLLKSDRIPERLDQSGFTAQQSFTSSSSSTATFPTCSSSFIAEIA